MNHQEIVEVQNLIKAIGTDWEKIKGLPAQLAELNTGLLEVRGGLDSLRKQRITNPETPRRKNWVVSPECAAYLTAIAAIGAEKVGKLSHLERSNRDWLLGKSSELLGMETKAALTTSDVPLPTVFPLGAGTVKLPKLSTDTAFGFITAMSGSVGEKVPQIGFVQFDAQKAGGIVRIPSEIDQDSIVPIGQFIARYGARRLAAWEDATFWMADASGTYNSLSGVCKAADTAGYKVQLLSTKTKPSDITLADLRTLRTKVDAAVLKTAGYCMHPTMEALLASFNGSTNGTVFVRQPDGRATLDGFPINWIGAMPVYDSTAHVNQYQATFGDLSFWYFGERGQVRVDISNDIYFATDEIGVRFLERFVPKSMADTANAVLQLAAS